MKKLITLILVFTVLLGGAGYWYWEARAASRTVFRFEEVTKDRLVATIGSTGTVQAQDVVDVGAQVQGRIVFIGEDKLLPRRDADEVRRIDWGSEVLGPVLNKDGTIKTPGTLLAQIDPSIYAAQVKAAEAAVKSANADKLQKNAILALATKEWTRAKELKKTESISDAEYISRENDEKVAEANLDVSIANIAVAEANLQNARTNLEYTEIRAPVNGVVVDRRVNVGQTVVASLSAPSCFLIAKDLSKMEVWATVNEVDISKIQLNQDVNFTVDTYPGRVYHGKVVPQGRLPLRLNAAMNQNVVTYTVVVSVNNEDRMLKPYMTTNLTFVIADKSDVLLVPNAALRWQPSKQQIAPDQQDKYFQRKAKKRDPADTVERGFVWMQDESGYVRFIELKLGLSDSVRTEVLAVVGGAELPEHAQLIIGEGRAGNRSNGANPFAPQMFKSQKKE
jgi:HlyD family secretion protein